MDWSALNVVWTCITLIGTIASTLLLSKLIGDYRAIKKLKINGIKMHVARIALLTEFSRWYVQAFFLELGVLAIATPPPSRILNDIIVGQFIASTIILTVVSFAASYIRKVVIGNPTEGGDYA